MKKIFAVLLILAMTLSFFGCGTKKESAGTDATAEKATEGEIASTACVHVWKEADCISPKTCTVCKATEGAVADHSWKEADCTTPKTCTVCKATEGEAAGHVWKEADCTAPKTCTVCKATEGEKSGHKYNGEKCTVCGAVDNTRAGVKKALNDCERYVTYLDIDADILETEIELYRMTGDTKYLLEIQDTVSEMCDYFSRIEDICEPYKDNYLGLMYDECDVDYPVITSSSLSGTSSLILSAKNMKIFYDSANERWG